MRLACWAIIVCAACTPAQTSYSIDVVPFGAGQFANDDDRKGTVFAIAEGATAATSFGTWLYLVDRYGVQCYCVPSADASHVNALQHVEIATGVAFLALYAVGVVDAIVHHRSRAPRSSSRVGRIARGGK
jgi:hypothetical protein